MRLKDFNGRVAIITGASSGIGKQVALDLARRGAICVCAARSRGRLEEAVDEVRRWSPRSQHFVCDVARHDQVMSMVQRALESYGRIDILVNNAGFGIYRSFVDAPIEYIEEVMRVNFFGAVYCLKEVLPIMIRRQEGWVVNVASISARLGTPKMGPYSASKFALAGLSESLDFELRPLGIRVAVVSPGPVRTGFRALYEGNAPDPPAWLVLKPEDVSREVLISLTRDRFEVLLPAALRAFARLKAVAPRLTRSLIHTLLRFREI
jgi:hypothetical protein